MVFEHFSHKHAHTHECATKTDFEKCVRRNGSGSEWIWRSSSRGSVPCDYCHFDKHFIDLVATNADSVFDFLASLLQRILAHSELGVHHIGHWACWLRWVNLVHRFKLCAKIDDGTWGSELVTNECACSDHMLNLPMRTHTHTHRAHDQVKNENKMQRNGDTMRRGENNRIECDFCNVCHLTFQCAHRGMCDFVYYYYYHWRRHLNSNFVLLSASIHVRDAVMKPSKVPWITKIIKLYILCRFHSFHSFGSESMDTATVTVNIEHSNKNMSREPCARLFASVRCHSSAAVALGTQFRWAPGTRSLKVRSSHPPGPCASKRIDREP